MKQMGARVLLQVKVSTEHSRFGQWADARGGGAASSRKQDARGRATNAAQSNTAWGNTDAKQMDDTVDTAVGNNNWGGASADNTGWGDTSADNGTWGNTGASAWGTTGTSGWGAGVPQPPEPPKAKETNAFSFGPPPPPPNNGTRSRTASTSGASSVTIAVRCS